MNPDLVPAWQLPEGKRATDFFDTRSPAGKKNLALFPMSGHHQTNAHYEMCLSYQWEKTTTAADKATCTDAFKTSYGWFASSLSRPALAVKLGHTAEINLTDQSPAATNNKNEMDTQSITPTADDNLAAKIMEHNQLEGPSAIAKRTPSTADDNLAAEITEQNQLKGIYTLWETFFGKLNIMVERYALWETFFGKFNIMVDIDTYGSWCLLYWSLIGFGTKAYKISQDGSMIAIYQLQMKIEFLFYQNLPIK